MPDPFIIKQGRVRSPFFPVIQPVPGNLLKSGDEIECIHPKINVKTKGIVTKTAWVFDWDEPHPIRDFIMHEYGLDMETMRNALVASDPAFDTRTAVIISIREII